MDAKAETAMDGVWKKGPGLELFAALDRVCLPHNLPALSRMLHLSCASIPGTAPGQSQDDSKAGRLMYRSYDV